MCKYLNFHIIQSIPTNCINRDDLGNVKTAIFGGALRQRISSQCFKREIRHQLEQGQGLSWRTKKLPYKLFQELTRKGLEKTEALERIGKMFTGTKGKAKDKVRIKDWEKILKGKAGPDEDQGPNKDNMVTDMLIFISRDEFNYIIEVCSRDMRTINDILSDGEKRYGASIALFGRMFADHKNLDVPAASSFNHALTTHEIAQESDYFSALDDWNRTGEGAGHLDYASFSTGTFYRHIILDPKTLKSNLSMTEGDISQLCGDFIKACYRAFPQGRKNSFSANTTPSYVLVEKSNIPLSLANAFEEPIKSTKGYIKKSIEALKSHRQTLLNDVAYRTSAEIESTNIEKLINFVKENC